MQTDPKGLKDPLGLSLYAMRYTPDSLSNHLTLDEALTRLASSEHVDGLALFGSRIAAAAAEASDYDLLILVHSLPVGIFQMLTHIDGRLADVVFVTEEMADRVEPRPPLGLAGGEPVSDRTNEGRFLLKMVTAKIVYDASGRLARVQAYAREHTPGASPAYSANYSAWFWQNHGLCQLQRMSHSSDPIRLTAVDLILSTGLNEACRAYCQLRGLAWQGEKAALRHLQAHDPAYLALLRACLAETDRPRRVQLYEQLIAATLQPAGGTWQPGLTAVALDGHDYGPAELDAALEFWESFFIVDPDLNGHKDP
jgi:predicted nucleotidyltransferase